MENLTITLIIPAYNEEQSIGNVVSKVKILHPDFDVVVVNDGSTDDTANVAEKAGARVFSHPYNMGNGAAVKSGIRAATGEILVFMDGDGQHSPDDIEKLLYYLPTYDMVVAARSNKDQASYGRALANNAYNKLARYVAKFPIKDLTSGFRAIKAELAQKYLYLLPNTYSYPTTLTLSVLRNGRSVKYIPIRIKKRVKGTSNIRTFRDGVRFLMIITKICTLFSPLRVFLPVCGTTFLFGVINYIYSYLSKGRFTNMSVLMLTTSILIFMLGLISEQICQMRYERSEGYPVIEDE